MLATGVKESIVKGWGVEEGVTTGIEVQAKEMRNE